NCSSGDNKCASNCRWDAPAKEQGKFIKGQRCFFSKIITTQNGQRTQGPCYSDCIQNRSLNVDSACVTCVKNEGCTNEFTTCKVKNAY
ncbi:MAG: hypothetical protein ABEN55_24290, partial [Bradymonadaceae bacterium]